MNAAAVLPLLALGWLWPFGGDDDIDTDDTIRSLEERSVEIAPPAPIADSSELARENYRLFLELVSDDPLLRAEAMRRLADLELEASEAAELQKNIEALEQRAFASAIDLYTGLLETYPGYERNDLVLYQLARAYENYGDAERALAVLDRLVTEYPDTVHYDEAQFRRGETLFVMKRYAEAEEAYSAIVERHRDSAFYQQSLYKLGWARFKQSLHEESLPPFFALLDLRLAGVASDGREEMLEQMSRPERELIEDTFRVLSISFSYMDGAESIAEYFARAGDREYAYVVYLNLGDLYLAKERYDDAAKTYSAFVESNPLHARAPLLQVEVMEAYKRGGFPSLVLEAKRDFVERYGMDGAYWQVHTRESRPVVVEHLKANLTDLAKYYHARAQAEGERTDYRLAARWYRKYLDFFPGEPDSANTNFLLAEILYESEDYAAATAEYERTAYDYGPHPRAAEAGYAALLAYRKEEERLPGPARGEWHAAYLDSALKFAASFPAHEESGAVLTTVAEDLFAQNEFDLAIGVARNVVDKVPPVEPALARTAWTVLAHSQFDLGRYAEAEQSYLALRPLIAGDETAGAEVDERIASAIYKQGEQAREAGDLEAAVLHFRRVAVAVPDAEIRETAEYDAAAALVNLGAWDRAAGVLEEFRAAYPDSEFADDVTQNLAVAYLESDRKALAAGEFERIADDETAEPEARREALWQAAELYEQSGEPVAERQTLARIVERYPYPLEESIEARHRLAEIAARTGDAAERRRWLEAIVDADAAAGTASTERSRYLAAKATLELTEPERLAFGGMKLTVPLDASLKAKKAMMERLLAAYGRAADYGVAEVTTASTYRIAEVYQQFSADLLDSERPPGLGPEELEQYELLLEDQAYPFEEKAIELHEVNAARAAEGVYDQWVQKSFAALATLIPARYAKTERVEDAVPALL